MSHTASTDLADVFSEDTREAFNETALHEAALVADLANRGIIPPSQLPKLHLVFDGEIPQLVTEAMEAGP